MWKFIWLEYCKMYIRCGNSFDWIYIGILKGVDKMWQISNWTKSKCNMTLLNEIKDIWHHQILGQFGSYASGYAASSMVIPPLQLDRYLYYCRYVTSPNFWSICWLSFWLCCFKYGFKDQRIKDKDVSKKFVRS